MVARFCDRCGGRLGDGGAVHGAPGADSTPHGHCRAARQLEPPRYCTRCGRRMMVQVTPDGWTARCARHPPVRHLDRW